MGYWTQGVRHLVTAGHKLRDRGGGGVKNCPNLCDVISEFPLTGHCSLSAGSFFAVWALRRWCLRSSAVGKKVLHVSHWPQTEEISSLWNLKKKSFWLSFTYKCNGMVQGQDQACLNSVLRLVVGQGLWSGILTSNQSWIPNESWDES